MKKTSPLFRMAVLLWAGIAINAVIHFVAVAQLPDENGIIYVKPAASGTGVGHSWDNATYYLQGAINNLNVSNKFCFLKQ